MKLRNKKTGKVFDVIVREKSNGDGEYSIIVCNIRALRSARSVRSILGEYDSLDELCEDWGDYTPKEPLIKDEGIRKALRASYDAAPYRDDVILFDGHYTFKGDKLNVLFDDSPIKIEGWTEGKIYSIEELCGEVGK